MGGKTIGDLLTAAGVTWGRFMGGFNLSTVNPNGTTGCSRTTTSAVTGVTESDYIPHHSLFAYWPSTANPTHTRPASLAEIGNAGPANHQYDIQDFYAAAAAGNLPAVSFLKAPGYQDASCRILRSSGRADIRGEHDQPAGKSADLEQHGGGHHVRRLRRMVRPSDRADRQQSRRARSDALTGPGACGTARDFAARLQSGNPHALGRCGYGPRLPLLVISPWAKGRIRRSHGDRPDFDHPFHRRQLAGRTAHRRRFIRCNRQLDQPDVRLHGDQEQRSSLLESEHGAKAVAIEVVSIQPDGPIRPTRACEDFFCMPAVVLG